MRTCLALHLCHDVYACLLWAATPCVCVWVWRLLRGCSRALGRAGCESVVVTQTKPPRAWTGTPADRAHDLGALTAPTLLFEGAVHKPLYACVVRGRRPRWAGEMPAPWGPDAADGVLCCLAGSAREAAALYPKNANVAAMLGLATAGLDETVVKLMADPAAAGNLVSLSFAGAAGKLSVQVEAAPSPSNPRTSYVVSLSVIKAVRKLCCATVVGL